MYELNINESHANVKMGVVDNNPIEALKDEESKISKIRNAYENNTTSGTEIVNRNIEDFSLDNPGKIKIAKQHSSANRPLHKLGNFTKNSKFCRCCNLPCKEDGIMEPFHFCDNIDMFSECGLGVTLYFYFFQFMTLIIFLGIIILSLLMIIFNSNYTDELIDICNNYYKKKDNNTSNLGYCEGFINSEENINLYRRFIRWYLRLSSDHLEVYRELPKQLTGNNNEKKFNKVIINYSILNNYFLVTSFILNIFFIIFIKTKIQEVKLLNLSLRDYTVLIGDSKKILSKYNNIHNIQMNENQINIENKDEFRAYINDYIRSYNDLDHQIYNINLCYELGNYISLKDKNEICKR